MSTRFETSVAGIRCICEVTHYSAEVPAVVTGTGFGDAEEGEPEEFEFIIKGIDGNRRMKALEELVTPTIQRKLVKQYKDSLLDF